MRTKTPALFALLCVACSSQSNPSQEVTASEPGIPPATTSAPQPSPEEMPASTSKGWAPDQACEFIGSDFGVEVRPYQQEDEDEYSCSTPYKNMQEDANLPNNLAYYAIGTQNLATEAYLVLNVNEPDKQSYAKGQLKKYAGTVARAVTGESLPSDISRAITSGSPFVRESNGYKQAVTHDDWPSGNGYELHYVITKSGEG